jgi:hypothetical protein
MGCDIHATYVAEKQGELKVVEVDVIDVRSYVLFGALAGVRSNLIRPLDGVVGRGLTDKMQELFPEGDALLGDHSFTYLSLDEITELSKRISAEKPAEIKCCCPCHKDDEEVIDNTEEIEYTNYVLGVLYSIISEMNTLAENYDNMYLVMGFDS